MFDESEISSLLSQKLELERGRLQGCLNRIRGVNPVSDDVKTGWRALGPSGGLNPTMSTRPMEAMGLRRFKITPSSNPVKVAAVDVSTARLGSVEGGVLTAFRGCLVWKNAGKYQFYRYGPLITFLESDPSTLEDERLDDGELSFNARAMSIMRNRVERTLQRAMVEVFNDSLILFDGSLTAGTPDNPTRVLKEILQAAAANRNTVIGVSKDTQIPAEGGKITQLIRGEDEASALCLDDYMRERFPSHPIHLLGRVYVAKMTRDGLTFRLDVSSLGGFEEDLRAIELLAGNDLHEHGYPETLRLAHILSSFTSNEILGMRRYMSVKFGVDVKEEVDVRRILFGPFST